ncbi:MAG: tetratricopeptide repeat protein [Gemmataceae bacterium]|nr:tetratricopeptide repeat protein [Gemmataceae bacterium]
MTVRQPWRQSAVVLLLGPALVMGCQHTGPTLSARPPAPPAVEGTAALSKTHVADVQIALGRTLEKRGAVEQAMGIYLQALQNDPGRADAVARLAVLHDLQGEFAASAPLYKKAVAAQPNNADYHCNQGYSFYLQQRWPEAEAALRRALSLAPEHARAQNNLGLVLAQTGRHTEALEAFWKAGCDEADARSNLAFVLTLQKRWPEARLEYEQALAVAPRSTKARRGLEELNAAAAKLEGDGWRRASTPAQASAALNRRPPQDEAERSAQLEE